VSSPGVNSNTPNVPEPTGAISSVLSCLKAIKLALDSLTGRVGSQLNRAVLFTDLLHYGLLTKAAVSSPTGTVAFTTVGSGGSGVGTWRDGTGAPSDALGINGDYYLDDATGDVYLKATGTYSVVANIKGPAGAPGPSGTTIASGGACIAQAGKPTAGQVWNIVLPYPINVPANLAGTVVYAGVAPTANAVFTVNYIRAGTTTTIGSATLAAGSQTSLSFSTQALVALLAGDVLQLVYPNPQDATLSGVSFTIALSS